MTPLPLISVILLTRNEGEAISLLLRETEDILKELKLTFEIIVIDAGSTDDTWSKAEALGARVHLQKRIGYGGALREGFLLARGEFIITFDADGSHSPKSIKALWNARHQGDIVVGSRFVAEGDTAAPFFRKILSLVLNKTFRTLLHVPVQDVSSGYRLYRASLLTPEQYRSEDFNILEEILIRAYADGFSVAEVPIHYLPRKGGYSKVSFIKFLWSYLHTLYELWILRNSVESADYDHRAYYSWIPLQRYWQRRRHALVTGFLRSNQSTLDIGCGSSKIIQDMPKAVAMDLAFRKLRYLKKTNPHRVQASTFSLPFANESFQQIVHSQVLEHIPFDKVIFQELFRVLKPHGTLVVGTPDYGRIWWPIIEFFYGKLLPNAYADEHITHYTKQMLIDTLAEYGFRTLEYRYICGGELIVRAVKV